MKNNNEKELPDIRKTAKEIVSLLDGVKSNYDAIDMLEVLLTKRFKTIESYNVKYHEVQYAETV
jgi:hypothetical protein